MIIPYKSILEANELKNPMKVGRHDTYVVTQAGLLSLARFFLPIDKRNPGKESKILNLLSPKGDVPFPEGTYYVQGRSLLPISPQEEIDQSRPVLILRKFIEGSALREGEPLTAYQFSRLSEVTRRGLDYGISGLINSPKDVVIRTATQAPFVICFKNAQIRPHIPLEEYEGEFSRLRQMFPIVRD